jgi:hypothetical protein
LPPTCPKDGGHLWVSEQQVDNFTEANFGELDPSLIKEVTQIYKLDFYVKYFFNLDDGNQKALPSPSCQDNHAKISLACCTMSSSEANENRLRVNVQKLVVKRMQIGPGKEIRAFFSESQYGELEIRRVAA